jgi:Tfp pilus assembly protein PilO
MLLIYILIVLFIFLLGYQTYLAILPTKLIENLENSKQEEYKPYNLNDPKNR